MHMGFHSSESYGATPYLIKRADGNIMIDVPRFNSKLADNVEEEGGIDTLILTHKDGVAHHQKWKDRFPGLQRIIHRADVTKDTEDCEIKLEGEGVWDPAPDYSILHTPGHTAGSISLLFTCSGEYGGDSVLFTGDHLAYTPSRKGLEGFKRYNHGNIAVQGDSIRMLAEDSLPFTWILPGHGRMARFRNIKEKNAAILKAAIAFDEEDDSVGMFGIGYY